MFLGGKEPTTLKELSAALGKETIDTFNTGESRGREVSHSLNYQKLGKELMSRDELAVMEGSKCILQLRGVRPFPVREIRSDAASELQIHKPILTKKLTFNIEKYRRYPAKLHPSDEFFVISETGGKQP